MSKTSVSVRAVVTVEMEVGTWGGGASFDSLQDQVTREAIQKIRSRLGTDTKVIGEPLIECVVYKR